jgi:uncharacterized membrane protein YgcG
MQHHVLSDCLCVCVCVASGFMCVNGIQMAIQFGYLALFSPVYPLAALMALLNNILEIRIDAGKLANVCRRPIWKAQGDIGSWFTVMNVIGFAAVMTNSTMVTFVGKLLAETDEMRDGGLNARVKSSNLWVIAVGMEHALFMLRVIVMMMLPHTPSWVGTMRNRLLWLEANRKSGLQIAAESELQTQFKAEMAMQAAEDGMTTPVKKGKKGKKGDEDEAPTLDELVKGNVHLHMKEKRYGKHLVPDSATDHSTGIEQPPNRMFQLTLPPTQNPVLAEEEAAAAAEEEDAKEEVEAAAEAAAPADTEKGKGKGKGGGKKGGKGGGKNGGGKGKGKGGGKKSAVIKVANPLQDADGSSDSGGEDDEEEEKEEETK